MIVRRILFVAVAAILATANGLPIAAVAQTSQDQTLSQQSMPAYRPPLRGAPGGRVGGASRGTFKVTAPLPTIELLAPGDHAGLTANPTPSLYFFASGPVIWPTRFTISAPGRPDPVLDATIPPPDAAGIYRLDVADYRVRLDPGIVYTWSVSAILDPQNRARDIVASANLMLSTPDSTAENAIEDASPVRRAALCARDGLWYDAVAAAVAAAPADRHVGLDALLSEVGLDEPLAFDRQATAPPTR
jgi:uncharacterized protein DUF928